MLQGAPLAVARSAYLQQVRRIAPPDPPGLLHRETELAELARFCLDPDGPPYVWWQAGPWAGKSALLSTFVLRPPAEVRDLVRIVSFFITARLAAQDTREAFTEVLLEQLASLLGQSLPPVLPEATREAYLLDLLSQAAKKCQDAGGRLVLVVDGLDEDRGVTTGPDAHSIAGLLPADLPAGMRVIVAGRPAPPIPDDVPGWHPLRDPQVVRPLLPSPHARDIQLLSRRELGRLLHGSQTEQDLLGLLTAARGGLSGPDLEELADVPLGEVEDVLHTVAGRTFATRGSQWASRAGTQVYLLSHEELQATASRYLGNRLAVYRDRIHEWAGAYRERRWPQGTPEYLLTGYHSLLLTSGDKDRIIAITCDSARHDRMLDLSGGDAAAMAEIRAALAFITDQATPDLPGALFLAYHRDRLTERNASIPARLPSVWATLGQLARAEALANSITDQDRRVEALTRVAQALNSAGQPASAAAAAATAESVARSIPDPKTRVRALAEVARTMAGTGQFLRAQSMASSISDSRLRALALAELALSLAKAGWFEEAKSVADSISSSYPELVVHALAAVARALAAAGRSRQASVIAKKAKVAAESVNLPDLRAQALAEVAEAVAVAGQPRAARSVVRSIEGPFRQAEAAVGVAKGLTEAGRLEDAQLAASAVTDPAARSRAQADVARALAAAGRPEQATVAASAAEAAVDSIADPFTRAHEAAAVVRMLAEAGQSRQAVAVAKAAESAARSVTRLDLRSRALAEAARGLTLSGQFQEAEQLIQTISNPELRGGAHADMAGALAAAGQFREAVSAASAISDRPVRVRMLAEIAATLAVVGQPELAAVALQAAEDCVQGMKLPESLAIAAEAFATTGHHRAAVDAAIRTEAAARSANDPARHVRAILDLAGWLITAEQPEYAATAARLAQKLARFPNRQATQEWALPAAVEVLAESGYPEEAESVARSIESESTRMRALAELSGTLAQARQFTRAESVARSIDDPALRASVLTALAKELAAAGQPEHAAVIAGLAESAALSIHIPQTRQQQQLLTKVAIDLASVVQRERAESVARSLSDPVEQKQALRKIAQLSQGAKAQQADKASRPVAAAKLSEQADHPQTAARAAEALTAVGLFREAEVAARSISDTSARDKSLKQIAAALASAGNGGWTGATKFPDEIIQPHNQENLRSMVVVTEELIDAGELKRAEAAARSIVDLDLQSGALGLLAEHLAQVGQYESAVEITHSIARPDLRGIVATRLARARAEIAGTLTSMSRHELGTEVARQAESLARSIPDTDLAAETLTQIAEVLARAGLTEVACQAAAATCMVAHWAAAARTVLAFNPSAFVALARLLEDE